MEEVYVVSVKVNENVWSYTSDGFTYEETMKDFQDYCYKQAFVHEFDHEGLWWRNNEVEYKVELGNEEIENGVIDLDDYRPDLDTSDFPKFRKIHKNSKLCDAM